MDGHRISRILERAVIVSALLLVSVVVVFMILLQSAAPRLEGNKAALGVVNRVHAAMWSFAASRTNGALEVAELSDAEMAQLKGCLRSWAIPEARFLVANRWVAPESGSEPVGVVICDTPYRNVPRTIFLNRNRRTRWHDLGLPTDLSVPLNFPSYPRTASFIWTSCWPKPSELNSARDSRT